MKLKMKDLYWLAGWLEGEGWFGWKSQKQKRMMPGIRAACTDEDVTDRAILILGKGARKYIKVSKKGYKTQYWLQINGERAAQWIMTLYCLMGNRRKQRFREMLKSWKNTPDHSQRAKNGWVKRRSHVTT